MYKIEDIRKGDVVLFEYIPTECHISDVQAVYRLVDPSVQANNATIVLVKGP